MGHLLELGANARELDTSGHTAVDYVEHIREEVARASVAAELRAAMEIERQAETLSEVEAQVSWCVEVYSLRILLHAYCCASGNQAVQKAIMRVTRKRLLRVAAHVTKSHEVRKHASRGSSFLERNLGLTDGTVWPEARTARLKRIVEARVRHRR